MKRELVSYRGIGNFKPLTSAEEFELGKRQAQGDEEAIELFIKHNIKFALSVALKYRDVGLADEDLAGAAMEGLAEAARRFDHTRGFRFISYAVWWIRQRILDHINKYGKAVRLPGNKVGSFNKIRQAREKLEQELERSPLYWELAEEVGVATEEVALLLAHEKEVKLQDQISFKQTRNADEYTLEELLGEDDQDFKLMEADELQEAQRKYIALLIKSLTPKEKLILTLRFGLGGQEPYTLEQLSDHPEVNLTRERVRQIVERLCKRLRVKSLEPSIKERAARLL